MLEAKPLTFFWRKRHSSEWSETQRPIVHIKDMSLHVIFSTKGFFAEGTEPTHVNSVETSHELKKTSNVSHL